MVISLEFRFQSIPSGCQSVNQLQSFVSRIEILCLGGKHTMTFSHRKATQCDTVAQRDDIDDTDL